MVRACRPGSSAQRRQLAHRDTERPSICDDVMHREQDHVIKFAQAEEKRPVRAVLEQGRTADGLQDGPVARPPPHDVLGPAAQILHGE